MVSQTVHSILLLENIGLKFDLSGVKRQRKHGIFTNWYHGNCVASLMSQGSIQLNLLRTVKCCFQHLNILIPCTLRGLVPKTSSIQQKSAL